MTFIRNDRSQLLQERCEWGEEWTLKKTPHAKVFTKAGNLNGGGDTSSQRQLKINCDEAEKLSDVF